MSGAVAGNDALRDALRAWFERGPTEREQESSLSPEVRAAAGMLDRALPTLTRTSAGSQELCGLFGSAAGEIVLTWCAANPARGDVRVAKLLTAAATHATLRERAIAAAHDRIVEGPLLDALPCAPLLDFSRSENAEARARMEILIWEAGASALAVPELGPWLWGNTQAFEVMIAQPARGTLRGRVLAARCLEISVRSMPATADPQLVGKTLQVLQPLLLHPEPLVWVHAARALGRLTGAVEQLEGTLLDWVRGESPLLRQRALTAFASLPAERLKMLARELTSILESPEEEAWVLAAAAAATPYLYFERREIWDRLAERILAGDGGAIAARALARGLATIWRRGTHDAAIEPPLRQLREMARRTRTASFDDWRRWLEVIATTDPVDDAERDPLDVELGLENLVRLAAQYDDEEADSRAARFASTLLSTFQEARKVVLGDGSRRHRAGAMNAFEGCARSLALRLWGPQLATCPVGDRVPEPDLAETWAAIASAPEQLLDLVRQRRQNEGSDPEIDLAIEGLAIRLGGYALDACGEDEGFGPGRGPTAHDTCLWLRQLDGLADGSRELPSSLKSALSTLFWRLVDTTRGTALGEVDDVQWLGPFAAWWALVIDRPAMLLQIATALPMIAEGALEKCCEIADKIRAGVASGSAEAMSAGQWGAQVEPLLGELHADETELANALLGLAHALEKFSTAAGPQPQLESMCLSLVLAAERLHAALADPVKALHASNVLDEDDSLSRRTTENAPRIAALLARAIRARETSMLDVWFSSLGPVSSALVETAVKMAVRRSPPPPPAKKKPEPKIIEGYELVKPIGEGGVGTVWLVRKPGAERFFVLKIPKAEALQNASDTEREGILASFVEEAKALAGLYHPNVASIIDRGVSQGVPFLVLELLMGCDLKEYSSARLMTLFELRQVVLESCAGLAALHGAGLVHRDIKPANLWLRLPLSGDEKFRADKHRDPAITQPLATVVIDFGMVRGSRVSAEVAGRFVAGTPGYIAPEQVLDPVELDGRADVYALAGTIYNVTTGKSFFDDAPSPRDRIIAHMNRDPFDDAERLRQYPAALAKLMRAATAKDWKDRPLPLEFGREFARCL
ncbi:MAG TPA: serine/threonine-protein kinase [Polyangiales bacterium]|nr:serine/threonine-protein kinase [Polyangiales bacterium]